MGRWGQAGRLTVHHIVDQALNSRFVFAFHSEIAPFEVRRTKSRNINSWGRKWIADALSKSRTRLTRFGPEVGIEALVHGPPGSKSTSPGRRGSSSGHLHMEMEGTGIHGYLLSMALLIL